jgi:hypothetical protein
MGKSPAIISCGSPPIVHAPLPSSSSLRGRFGNCRGRAGGDGNGGKVKSLSVISSETVLRRGSRSGTFAISQSRYSSGNALRSWPLYLPNGISILPTGVTTCSHDSEVGLRSQASLKRNMQAKSNHKTLAHELFLAMNGRATQQRRINPASAPFMGRCYVARRLIAGWRNETTCDEVYESSVVRFSL